MKNSYLDVSSIAEFVECFAAPDSDCETACVNDGCLIIWLRDSLIATWFESATDFAAVRIIAFLTAPVSCAALVFFP